MHTDACGECLIKCALFIPSNPTPSMINQALENKNKKNMPFATGYRFQSIRLSSLPQTSSMLSLPLVSGTHQLMNEPRRIAIPVKSQ